MGSRHSERFQRVPSMSDSAISRQLKIVADDKRGYLGLFRDTDACYTSATFAGSESKSSGPFFMPVYWCGVSHNTVLT